MTKVLYIVGYPRSGTTLLGNLLGELDGFFHMGEVHWVWDRASRIEMAKNRCGCERTILDCAVWNPILAQVIREVEGDSELLGDPASWPDFFRMMRELQVRAQGRWGVARRAALAGEQEQYRHLLQCFYQATGRATGARVLVDSSKFSGPAGLLRRMNGVSPYFLHIVRDPRGVVLSRQRRQVPRSGECYQLSRVTAVADTLRWLRHNFEAEMIGRKLPRGHHIFSTYENFIADPRGTLTNVLEALGEAEQPLEFLGERVAHLQKNHTICGNLNRFSTGEVPLRVDERWRRNLRRSDRWLITAFAGAGLLRYGYSLRAGDVPARPGNVTEAKTTATESTSIGI